MWHVFFKNWGTDFGTDMGTDLWTDLGTEYRLGNILGVFFKNFVKDNVVTKIHTFKNKNDFKNSGDIFFCGTDLGNRLGYRLGNRIYELAYYSNLDLAWL